MSTPDSRRPRSSTLGVEALLICSGLLLEAGGFAVFALLVLITGDITWFAALLFAALLSLVAMCVVISATQETNDLGITKPIIWAQIVLQFGLSLYCGLIALDSALNVADFGPSNRPWYYLAAIVFSSGLLIGCGKVALGDGSSRLAPARRHLVSVVGLALSGLFVFSGLASATVQTETIGCSLFSFDHDQWLNGNGNGDRERVAHALVRCETLIGKSRAQVRGMLGRGRDGKLYVVSSRTDFVGDVDSRTLTVTYGADDRVKSTKLSAPINAD